MAKKSKALLEAEAKVAELNALLEQATAPKPAGITLGEATAKEPTAPPSGWQ